MADHALVVPKNFVDRDVAFVMIDARGKEITRLGPKSISTKWDVTPLQIASAMEPDEVPQDVKVLGQIVDLCAE